MTSLVKDIPDDFAEENEIVDNQVIAKGFKDKSKEFKEKGSEVYL